MFLGTRKIWKCHKCRKQFSVKAGTIFEDSAINLGHWLTALWMIMNCKNCVSSYEIARDLGITAEERQTSRSAAARWPFVSRHFARRGSSCF